jgi:ubiquinone biosynthesis protein Coq4
MKNIKALWLFFRLYIKVLKLYYGPKNNNPTAPIADLVTKGSTMRECYRIVFSDPACIDVIKNRRTVEDYSVPELSKLPIGTLGRTFADYLISQKLDNKFYRRPDVVSDITFFQLRMRQTHDLYHVVTGLDITIEGELALYAFHLAQMALPLSYPIIGFSVWAKLVFEQEKTFSLFDGLAKGWVMGRNAKLLFPYDWQASWSKELETVRRELNILEAGMPNIPPR